MKKLIYAIIIIAIIAFVIYLCNTDSGILSQNTIKTNENTQKENNITNSINNKNTTNTVENKIENTVENVIDNTITDTNEVIENTITNEISTETFEEQPKTEQEKAKEIVKNDWKDISNCEISIDGINENGSYVVTIRDSKTTQALAYYIVNVKNETFTKKIMN